MPGWLAVIDAEQCLVVYPVDGIRSNSLFVDEATQVMQQG